MTLKDLCLNLEHYETPEWAVDAILKHEKLIGPVIDPCTGTGISGNYRIMTDGTPVKIEKH